MRSPNFAQDDILNLVIASLWRRRCGVDAVGGAELAGGFRQIIPDGSFGEVEGIGDFLRGFALPGLRLS